MHAENSLGRPSPQSVSTSSEPSAGRRQLLRRATGWMLAFGALAAFDGGYYGLMGAKGVPRQWLEHSPFTDYLVPSLVLMLCVGGVMLLGCIAVFAHWQQARAWTLAAAVILLIWLSVQVLILGFVSYLQPTTAVFALVLLALGLLLPGPDRPPR